MFPFAATSDTRGLNSRTIIPGYEKKVPKGRSTGAAVVEFNNMEMRIVRSGDALFDV